MPRILITSGPTRQFLDPVRYLTNASSGRMGKALAESARQLGHEVTVVTGPVAVEYPKDARVISVVSTEEMLAACQQEFQECVGVIGAAAPCDYRPRRIEDHKIAKTGTTIELQLEETPDVIATLGKEKSADQWVVGFALETADARFRALTKLEKKRCDLMVLNGPAAIDAELTSVELLDKTGSVVAKLTGSKSEVATSLLAEIQKRLITPVS